jgi:hypothetical protein
MSAFIPRGLDNYFTLSLFLGVDKDKPRYVNTFFYSFLAALTLRVAHLNVRAISALPLLWFSENKSMEEKQEWEQVSNTAKI